MENKFLLAKQLIREAGAFIKNHMSADICIEEKTQFDDLVTNLDKETQAILIKKIKSVYPNDHIIAEENKTQPPISVGNVWVIDPIDGTINFIVQQSQFVVMLAYYESGVGQFGLIYDVTADILYSGGGQFDVYANDVKLKPYQLTPLNRCLIGSNSAMFADNYRGIRDLVCQTLGVRVYGGAGISMCHVMSGKLMCYFSYLQPWDYAAASIMGEKLGYCLLTLDGELPNFSTRQKIMFVPKEQLTNIKKYIT